MACSSSSLRRTRMSCLNVVVLAAVLVVAVTATTAPGATASANLNGSASDQRRTLSSLQSSQSQSSHSFRRFLEDNANNEEENNDWSQYTLRQGHCFRMKIVSDNDDDGNSYFYNGAYRAQYKRYVSYLLCPASNAQSNYNNCHEYVSGLEDYLEQTVPFVQTYCNTCAATCGRRHLQRQLEDAAQEEDAQGENQAAEENVNQMTVDCSVCANECKLLNSNKANSGTDESGYIGCQAADAANENGMQYYTAPQCENDKVVIGHFYDAECTIKTSTLSDSVFSYNTFQTIAALQLQCGLEGSGGAADDAEGDNQEQENTCASLEERSVDCEDVQDQQEQALCKAATAAGRVYTYYKQPFYQKIPITLIALLLFLIGSGFGFLSYTYYVRHHRTNKTLIPMAELDHDLPPIS